MLHTVEFAIRRVTVLRWLWDCRTPTFATISRTCLVC